MPVAVRTVAIVGGLAGGLLVTPVGLGRAQQIDDHGTFPNRQCELCHVSHAGGSGPYVLTGDTPGSPPRAWLPIQAPGAGTVSETCLRCHWDESHRRAQPDMSSPPLTWTGAYVGPDLSDDHFLGTLAQPETVRPYELWRTPGGGNQPFYQLEVVECTLCHAAHDATAQTPRPNEQYQFCGGCHADESARGYHQMIACAGCHKLHNSAVQSGLFYGLTIENTCTRCHGVSQQLLPDSLRYTTVSGGLPSVPAGHNFGTPCQNCHTLHAFN